MEEKSASDPSLFHDHRQKQKSLVESKDETEIDRVLSTIPDPVGTFYRYGLPGSLLQRKRPDGVRQAPLPSR